METYVGSRREEIAELRDAWRFFQQSAGFATPPGRAACALELARAEASADVLGWRLVCETDADGWATFGDDGPYYVAVLVVDGLHWNESPRILATLGGIDVSDAEDQTYWRILRAELAAEAIAENGWSTLAADWRNLQEG